MEKSVDIYVETPVIKSKRYTVSYSDNHAYISKIYYPLPGWGNKVATYIRATNDSVEIYEVRDNWNGTGRTTIAYVPDEKLAMLVREKALEAVKYIEQKEYKKVAEIYESLRSTIEKEEEKYW